MYPEPIFEPLSGPTIKFLLLFLQRDLLELIRPEKDQTLRLLSGNFRPQLYEGPALPHREPDSSSSHARNIVIVKDIDHQSRNFQSRTESLIIFDA